MEVITIGYFLGFKKFVLAFEVRWVEKVVDIIDYVCEVSIFGIVEERVEKILDVWSMRKGWGLIYRNRVGVVF